MKSKLFLFFAIVSVAGMLAISGCDRDDDDQSNRRNGRNTGTLNGHEWVDLGLPSGLLWATCNVGATSPEDFGSYFAWGETTPKNSYIPSNYRYSGDNNTFTKYCNLSSYGNNGFTDNLTTLVASDDAATANWGSNWRMPTRKEMDELVNNCTIIWTTQNGVDGSLFTGPNGNSIFLPATGMNSDGLSGLNGSALYWTSSLNTAGPDKAIDLTMEPGSCFVNINGGYRDYGLAVRPVCE